MTFFKSVFLQTCPKCREGKLFKKGSLFTMHDNCPSCQQKYMLEPGFYWGAMYVSYMLSGGFALVLAGILFLGTDWSKNTNLTIMTIATLLIMPIVYRISRSIWIHVFVKYDPTVKTHS